MALAALQTALKPPLPAAAKGTTPRLGRVPTLNLQPRVSADGSDDDDSPRSRVNSMSENGSHYEDVVMDGDSVQVCALACHDVQAGLVTPGPSQLLQTPGALQNRDLRLTSERISCPQVFVRVRPCNANELADTGGLLHDAGVALATATAT